ncbi:hypothetical protein PSU4_61050 [Pseudonocardia sulfidoxydans NBRC 16205]|uniref:Transposase IS4-like domain-containing protein n=1 Tax=Pseudonocardia sulfidoxydans NBRC 16205 TaxID=1223511 RepID=A0A511DQN0_9PSEU|nr:hypothetical protein PSU4_61050 [Pseudonocardia sulfidoxydans NBRC 16205]
MDPDTRHAHKTRNQRRDGYKAHLVVEPDTGIITATALTPASGSQHSDAAVGIELLARDQTLPDTTSETGERHPDEADQPVVEVLADSAYGTGDMLAALADRRASGGHQTLPATPDRRGRVQHRRLHHRRGRGPGELPERAHHPLDPESLRGLRGPLPRLPTRHPLHHLGGGADPAAAPPRRPAPRSPRRSPRP